MLYNWFDLILSVTLVSCGDAHSFFDFGLVDSRFYSLKWT